MKSIIRFASATVAFILIAIPSMTFAASSIYSDSNGNFQYSSDNFQIGWGSGSGMSGFACGSNNICQVASTILFIINSILVPLLFAISFIVFLFGIAKAYIFSAGGDPEMVKKGHKLILWGLIGFAVMISLWGLVNVVVNTFMVGGYAAPPLPTSY